MTANTHRLVVDETKRTHRRHRGVAHGGRAAKILKGNAPYSVLIARHVQKPGRKARKARAEEARRAARA